MAPAPNGSFLKPQVVEGRFDDIDAMAVSPLAWNQEYEQIGRGRFQGQLTQLVLNRCNWPASSGRPACLQRGSAPAGTWVFGLPLVAEGSLHVRRRPALPANSWRRHRATMSASLRPDEPTSWWWCCRRR